MRTLLIIAAAALVLGVVLAVLVVPPQQATAPTSDGVGSQPPSAAGPQPPQPVPPAPGAGGGRNSAGNRPGSDATQQAGVSGTSTPDSSELAVGSGAETSGLRVDLTSVRRESTGSSPPKAGIEYLIISLTLENTSTREKTVNAQTNFYVKDSAGQQYKVTTNARAKTPLENKIAPDDKLRGEWAFEVPKSATGLSFVYDPLTGGKALSFKLDR